MKDSILLVSSESSKGSFLDNLFLKNEYIVYFSEQVLKAINILSNTNISIVVYETSSKERVELGFIEHIRKKYSYIKVIVITKTLDPEVVIEVMKAGAYNILFKPANEPKLLNLIKTGITEKKLEENRLINDRKNKEYHKVLLKELEISKSEIDRLQKEIEIKNMELEKAYGSDYFKKHADKDSYKKSERKIGKYTLLEEVGSGGMSIVYKAIDPVLNRVVAIKELTINLKDFPEDVVEEVVKRFEKEARVIAALKNDNIIKVFDVTNENDRQYIIMEYVEGQTLETIIKNNKKLPILEAVSIVSEVCLALDYIHTQKIIHRDIKPSNIMIGNDRNVKIMDFGVIRDTSVTNATPTGTIIGTLSYTAPEQSLKNMDHRVDIFSLGTVLYELVTGFNPFQSNTYADTFVKIASFIPDAPSKYNPDCNAILDEIILKSMEKNPSKRYASAKAFYKALIEFIENYKIANF